MFHSTSPYYELDSSSVAFFDGVTLHSTSLPSNDNIYMHRSNSTHSFTHSQACSGHDLPSNLYFSSSSPSSACEFLDFSNEPVRRVLSTGDLQATAENCTQEIARVGRYSAEERMKKIEKYRNKRNQRNFQKKITYACRKTLADSRPRVRGRFARNGETEAEAETETSGISYEACNNHQINNNDHENRRTYNNHGVNNNGNNVADGWWRQMQSVLVEEAEGSCYVDDELWTIENIFSMNLLS